MTNSLKNKILTFALTIALVFCSCTGSDLPHSGSDGDLNNTSSPSENSSSADLVSEPEKEVVTYETYGSFWLRQHDDTVMPVGAYNSCPPSTGEGAYSYITDKNTFKYYAEAGVNMMMGLYEYTASDEVYQALEWCSDYNIGYLVRYAGGDDTNASYAKALLAKARYYDAFAGVMQIDEPGRCMFEKIAKSADIINSVIPAEIVDSTLLHVNLFPTYATQKQLYNRVNTGDVPGGSYTYDQYIQDYFDIVNPKVLSYDNYPLSGGENVIRGKSYFSNMAIIRRAALEHNVPFWVFIQTCSFNGGTRIPNRAELLWQVNTALSYGSKGIQYFCGVCPPSGSETFDGAMFDLYGNKTDVYYHVKDAGIQIAAVDQVLMHCKSQGIMIVGDLPYSGESGIPAEDVLVSYGGLYVDSITAAHAFIGCFDHDGKPAYYITNNSIVENDSVELLFEQAVKGYVVQEGNRTEFNGMGITLNLKAGEGVLLGLE